MNGTVIYSEAISKLPKNAQTDKCQSVGFLDQGLSKPLPDGRYETKERQIFMMQSSCLMPMTGEAKLSNGQAVGFYQKHVFSDDGEMVFVYQQDKWIPAPDGKYKLETGAEFSVSRAALDNYGEFDNGKIVYPDRN